MLALFFEGGGARGGGGGGGGALILGSLSYTSHARFFFVFFLNSREFLLPIPCWLRFMRGVSLTHPILALFFI